MRPDEHLQQDLAGETGAVERGKAAPLLSPQDVGWDSRRPKRNDILLHVAAISICLIAAALLVAASLWRASPAWPPQALRPPGSLQRRQVDYFGYRFVKGWPGIASASRAEVGEAIAAAKDPLRAASGGGGFSEGKSSTGRSMRMRYGARRRRRAGSSARTAESCASTKTCSSFGR